MDTIYTKMTEEQIDPEQIRLAGEILRGGGLVAFPTETVYGLGGDAFNPESSRKIYAAKGRPSDNPLIVHICRLEDMERVAVRISDEAWKLARAFWPGPLTMILHKCPDLPAETTGGLDTVAVRFPSNKIAQALIGAGGGFIAAPSANRSGRPSPTLARYCREDLDGRVEMIIDGGQVGLGLESTIIDLTEKEPAILRPGFVTWEDLQEVLGKVNAGSLAAAVTDGAPKAPGMKYRHYAPQGQIYIVEGDQEKVISTINELSAKAADAGMRVAVLCAEESKEKYTCERVFSLGSLKEEKEISAHLFAALRAFDTECITVIYSESFEQTKLHQAIMNRLRKAAGYQTIQAK
jgi:L-threonylcarbamoyladenylate synthase